VSEPGRSELWLIKYCQLVLMFPSGGATVVKLVILLLLLTSGGVLYAYLILITSTVCLGFVVRLVYDEHLGWYSLKVN